MEQFDTDENLVNSDKKKENPTARYLLIGIICLIIVVAAFILFKIFNSAKTSSSNNGI